MALTLDELARIPRRIAIASGAARWLPSPPCRAAGCDKLITDDRTATAVVETLEEQQMQLTRDIGSSGITASAVDLGTWAMGGWLWGGGDDEASVAAIRASLDAGDHADRHRPGLRPGPGARSSSAGPSRAAATRSCWSPNAALSGTPTRAAPSSSQDDKTIHRYLGAHSVRAELEASLAACAPTMSTC